LREKDRTGRRRWKKKLKKRKKFSLQPSTSTQFRFSTLNYKTKHKRLSNYRNRASLALWVILEIVFHFVKM
jgi:hypothetical protein